MSLRHTLELFSLKYFEFQVIFSWISGKGSQTTISGHFPQVSTGTGHRVPVLKVLVLRVRVLVTKSHKVWVPVPPIEYRYSMLYV